MKYLAKFLGAIATIFYGWAERIDPDWDSEWVRIRDAVRQRYAELDEGWDTCNLPTMPCPPPIPGEEDDDRCETSRRIEIPPPAIVRAEKRRIWNDSTGKAESVNPPPGTWWGRGGSS